MVGLKKLKMGLVFFSISIELMAHQSDVVVFSYNRPLQLYAFLESLYKYASNIEQTSVIYRSSDEEYRKAYEEVMHAFPQVKFVEQLAPPDDFKPLVLREVFELGSSEYVTFAVDDIIVKDYFDFNECIEALESTQSYAFYLRLGLHIQDNPPPFTKVGDRIYKWKFSMGDWYWGYPNTVDMSLYRKKEIEGPLRHNSYNYPNPLEGNWADGADLDVFGLCFETSKMINIPLNAVNVTSTSNLHIDPKDLLRNFNEDLKIDISVFFQINNKLPHEEHYPTYINR